MIDKEIKKILEMSWSREICYPTLKESWSIDNPSLGECDITALVVNDFLGGKIMRTMCGNTSHYYNVIQGNVYDFTVDQFKGITPNYSLGEERSREYLLSNKDTENRYLLLLKNVKENFNKYGDKKYKLLSVNNKFYDSLVPGTIAGNKKLKIYGRFDCPSALNWIKKGKYVDNRVFFENKEVAISLGYRPCGICLKKEYREWAKKEKN